MGHPIDLMQNVIERLGNGAFEGGGGTGIGTGTLCLLIEFKILKHNNDILFPRFHTWICFLFYSKSINIRHIF